MGFYRLSRRIPAERLAQAIAGSRICINIHQDDGIAPVNPMFFAIPATGTCQMAEKRDYFDKWLKADIEYASFEDGKMIQKLESLLESDDVLEDVSLRGYSASQEHTYERRIETILTMIGYK